ncbi:unnamed protein product [Echinostoma caproni]|uniref:Septin-type G domain-containing protein n=1 Tax=Echinostoma caproni TaxID=27848 RepID=A0A183ARV9_9TREM|nr:unnamed protein product [Echinostoma caproni]
MTQCVTMASDIKTLVCFRMLVYYLIHTGEVRTLKLSSHVGFDSLPNQKYLQEELKMKRSLQNFHDTRIHVCLYFIALTASNRLMLWLVTKTELQKFKARILSEIQSNEISIYQFPTDDETVSDVNTKMNQHVPFAVVGSGEEIKINGKNTRVRQYPWGAVQVDNEAHCDFVRLREMLLRINMEDLRERTHTVNYETYRRQRLIEMGFRDDEKMSLQAGVFYYFHFSKDSLICSHCIREFQRYQQNGIAVRERVNRSVLYKFMRRNRQSTPFTLALSNPSHFICRSGGNVPVPFRQNL